MIGVSEIRVGDVDLRIPIKMRVNLRDIDYVRPVMYTSSENNCYSEFFKPDDLHDLQF